MIKSAITIALVGLSVFSNAAPTLSKRDSGGKRGLAFQKDLQTRADLFKNGLVSWGYDWEARVTNSPPTYKLPGFEWVPMLHGPEATWTNAWNADVEASIAAGSKHILSLNEPDQCGGGGTCTDVGTALAVHRQWIEPIAKKHPDVKIGSIAVNNGEEANMGLSYLQKFLDGCNDCQIDFICVHWYGDPVLQQFTDYMEMKVKPVAAGRPVWVTEWKNNGAANKGFIEAAMSWMDKPEQAWIARYAVQSVEEVLAPGGVLSDIGAAYAAST